MSVAIRRRLKIAPHGPLPARELAAKLDIRFLDVDELPGFARKTQNGNRSACYWRELATLVSAPTVLVGTDTLIIYDAAQPPARQESRLMRELAHAILQHVPDAVVERCGVRFSRFDAVQEAEAAYLGGCLQIPREGLLWALGRRMSIAEIAHHFGASEQMVRYRRSVTGVHRQLARRARRHVRDGS